MSDYIGNIPVPEIVPSGVFPLVPDFPHGRALRPQVAIHQFGSGNAKTEQRFLLGHEARRFLVRKQWLRDSDRVALRNFWETKYGSYGAFTCNAPNDDGLGTTACTCRFANEPLSWEMLTDAVSTLGVTLIEIPSSSPAYTLNQTVTRFPPQALKDALLSQVQEIIPVVKIQPLQAGYPAIHVSDRRCTIGSQLYQARLLEFDGISQGMGNEADEATFTFGKRLLIELVEADAPLVRALERAECRLARRDAWIGALKHEVAAGDDVARVARPDDLGALIGAPTRIRAILRLIVDHDEVAHPENTCRQMGESRLRSPMMRILTGTRCGRPMANISVFLATEEAA